MRSLRAGPGQRPGLGWGSAALLALVASCAAPTPPGPDGGSLPPEVAALQIVYASRADDEYELFLRNLGEDAPVQLTTGLGALYPAVSPDGSEIAFTSSRGAVLTLGKVRLSDGQVTRFTTPLFSASQPAWSPDGQTLVFEGRVAETAQADLYSIPAAGGAVTRLTTAPERDVGPAFSADGQFVFFISNRAGTYEVWRMKPDGTDQVQVTPAQQVLGRPAVAPDGATLVFARARPGQSDVAELARYDLGTQRSTVMGVENDGEPAFSADGRFLAFTTLRYGNPEVVVMGLEAAGPGAVRVTDSAALDGAAAFVPRP